ncbi:MAG TPA: DUF456 domain-containing protein [Ohtaekwangia sp.]|uniref:DUF456 domain-containing protein n=1 Tax=Ohtaekwangia sp. TaxID=2066019 RepID=UPI002F931BE2
MDVLWVILGIILLLGGLAGCILPFLPGPPLCFIALLLLQLKTMPPFTTRFLIIWGAIAAVVTLLDYIIPVYGTKKFGGSRYGVWGCTIGLLIGIWLGPWGIILGPFVGAFVGEILASSNSSQALRAALGSFIGFLFGTLLKLIVCLVMSWYFVASLFQ